jgi:methyl coenzyme M reductase subunit D
MKKTTKKSKFITNPMIIIDYLPLGYTTLINNLESSNSTVTDYIELDKKNE